MSDGGSRSQQVSGVSNLAADLVTLLPNKLDAIAALERYQQDAQQSEDVAGYLQQLQQQEVQAVERLRQLVLHHLAQDSGAVP